MKKLTGEKGIRDRRCRVNAKAKNLRSQERAIQAISIVHSTPLVSRKARMPGRVTPNQTRKELLPVDHEQKMTKALPPSASVDLRVPFVHGLRKRCERDEENDRRSPLRNRGNTASISPSRRRRFRGGGGACPCRRCGGRDRKERSRSFSWRVARLPDRAETSRNAREPGGRAFRRRIAPDRRRGGTNRGDRRGR